MTKYQESERFHSSLYNQNHHWAYPMVFENFIHNNENIEDEVQIRSPLPTSGPVTSQRPDFAGLRIVAGWVGQVQRSGQMGPPLLNGG